MLISNMCRVCQFNQISFFPQVLSQLVQLCQTFNRFLPQLSCFNISPFFCSSASIFPLFLLSCFSISAFFLLNCFNLFPFFSAHLFQYLFFLLNCFKIPPLIFFSLSCFNISLWIFLLSCFNISLLIFLLSCFMSRLFPISPFLISCFNIPPPPLISSQLIKYSSCALLTSSQASKLR